MTLYFDYEAELDLHIDYENVVTKVVKEVLNRELCPYDVEINVILTNNEKIRKINNAYRGIDAPTDVLSFPMIEYDAPSNFSKVEESAEEYFNLDTGELLLGDIIISLEKVREQAEKYGHTVERELAFLTAHSMFHLCGYDHCGDGAGTLMEEKQEAVLSSLGIRRESEEMLK